MADIHLTTTSYPTAIDTATTLRDDVTAGDGTGDIIQAIHQNGPASAIIAIETALGVNPFGSAADVASRLNTGLNPNGTLKVSGGTVAPNRLLFGGTAGAIESNPTILVNPSTGQLQLDTQGSAGGLRIGLDTLLYRSGVDQLRTPDSLQIDASLTVLGSTTLSGGLVTPTGGGTANQLLGNNAGGTALEYKTLQGTANQITVTHSAGAITLSAPQDLHTGASPQFVGMQLTGATGNTLTVSRFQSSLGEAIKIYKSIDAAQAWLTWSQGAELSGVWRVGFTGAPYDLRFCVGSATDLGTEVLRLTTDGRVGIGTSTPETTLHVDGSVRVGPTSGGYIDLTSSDTGLRHRWHLDPAGVYRYQLASNVGAGFGITGHDGGGLRLSDSGGNHATVYVRQGGTGALRAGNVDVLRWNSSGYVGIGKDPLALLDIAANGNVTTIDVWRGISFDGLLAGIAAFNQNPTGSSAYRSLAFYATGWDGTNVVTQPVMVVGAASAGFNVGIGVTWPAARLDIDAGLSAVPALNVRRPYDGGRIRLQYANNTSAFSELGMTFYGAGKTAVWLGTNLDTFGAAHQPPTQGNAGGSSWILLLDSMSDACRIGRIAPGGGSTQSYFLSVKAGGNVGFNTDNQFGGGSGVIGLANATTAPTMNPTGGIVLYAEDGRLTYRSPRGEFVKLDMTATLSVGYHLQRGRLFL